MAISEKTQRRLSGNYGKWVLITGATSGIGLEMAQQFAAAGFQLVLTGRRRVLLNELAAKLIEQYQIEVKAIAGDLSLEDEVTALIDATTDISIGISVLNAGFGTSGSFLSADLGQELNMLQLNCRAVLRLSHHFSQRFHSEKRRGAIVLVSSMVAFQGVPNAAHYAATKAYVQALGEGLATELKPMGIDVLCAAPGPTESGFAERANMQMGQAMKPSQVATPIIKAIGRQKTILPGFLTKFLVYNLRMTPRWARTLIMGTIMGGFTKNQEK